MKHTFTILMILISGLCYSQTVKTVATKPAADKKEQVPQSTTSDYGWSQRFAFIFGGGPSYIHNTIYQDPVIDRATTAVVIEESERVRTNLSIGLVYTPWVSDIIRTVNVKAPDGTIVKQEFVEYYPRGATIALFINPVSLTNLSDNTFTSSVDLGIGLGWRSGNFSLLGTAEFFGVRQPKNYFINNYKNNDKPFVVDGQTQLALDVNDNSIFKTKIITALGVKLCYTFDLAKSFYANSKTITEQSTQTQ